METSPDGSKRRKKINQSEDPVVDALANTELTANFGIGTEPNFNLNLNLSSPSNPRATPETRKLPNGGAVNRKDDGNTNAGRVGNASKPFSTETGKSTTATFPGEKEGPSGSSKISSHCHSSKAEETDHQRGEGERGGRLTLSPDTHCNPSSTAATRLASISTKTSPRLAGTQKTQTRRTESASILTSKPNALLKTATKPTDGSAASPRLHTNRTENPRAVFSVSTVLSPETHPPRTVLFPVGPKPKPRWDDTVAASPKTPCTATSAKTHLQKNHSGTANVKTPHTAASLKPHTEAHVDSAGYKVLHPTKSPKTNTRRDNADTTSKTVSDHESDSKASSSSKSRTGSKDSLDSKSASTDSKASSSQASKSNSKSSCGSKAGSKNSSASKDSSHSKTGTGSKHGPDSKTGSKSKAASNPKGGTELKGSLASKSNAASKVDINPKTNPDSNPCLSGSDSKTTSKSSPKKVQSISGSKLDPVGSLHPSPISPQLLSDGSTANNKDNVFSSPKPSPGLKSCSDPQPSSVQATPSVSVSPRSSSTNTLDSGFKSSPDSRSTSKPGLVEPSSSPRDSPQPTSASTTSSWTFTTVGSGLMASSSENQQSLSPAEGWGVMPVPRATSSPKSTATVAMATRGGASEKVPSLVGPVPMATEDSSTPHDDACSLSRGVTFDPITVPPPKPPAVAEHSARQRLESKMAAAAGRAASLDTLRHRGDARIRDDVATPDRSPGLTRTPGTPPSRSRDSGNVAAIATDTRCPRQSVSTSCSSLSLSPLSSTSSPPPTSTAQLGTSMSVTEEATMTDVAERLRVRPAEQREVGVQAEVELVDRSASTSSLVGPPAHQSDSSTSPAPPLSAAVTLRPTAQQHTCKIDIELRGQSLLPLAMTDNKAMSLPANMRAYSFERNSSQETGEEDGRGGGELERRKPHAERRAEGKDQAEAEEKREGVKPQQVAWDEQGMTWEVYGGPVEPGALGTAIQSHLQSRITHQATQTCTSPEEQGSKKTRRKRRKRKTVDRKKRREQEEKKKKKQREEEKRKEQQERKEEERKSQKEREEQTKKEKKEREEERKKEKEQEEQRKSERKEERKKEAEEEERRKRERKEEERKKEMEREEQRKKEKKETEEERKKEAEQEEQRKTERKEERKKEVEEEERRKMERKEERVKEAEEEERRKIERKEEREKEAEQEEQRKRERKEEERKKETEWEEQRKKEKKEREEERKKEKGQEEQRKRERKEEERKKETEWEEQRKGERKEERKKEAEQEERRKREKKEKEEEAREKEKKEKEKRGKERDEQRKQKKEGEEDREKEMEEHRKKEKKEREEEMKKKKERKEKKEREEQRKKEKKEREEQRKVEERKKEEKEKEEQRQKEKNEEKEKEVQRQKEKNEEKEKEKEVQIKENKVKEEQGKKEKRVAGGILGCWRKAPAVTE